MIVDKATQSPILDSGTQITNSKLPKSSLQLQQKIDSLLRNHLGFSRLVLRNNVSFLVKMRQNSFSKTVYDDDEKTIVNVKSKDIGLVYEQNLLKLKFNPFHRSRFEWYQQAIEKTILPLLAKKRSFDIDILQIDKCLKEIQEKKLAIHSHLSVPSARGTTEMLKLRIYKREAEEYPFKVEDYEQTQLTHCLGQTFMILKKISAEELKKLQEDPSAIKGYEKEYGDLLVPKDVLAIEIYPVNKKPYFVILETYIQVFTTEDKHVHYLGILKDYFRISNYIPTIGLYLEQVEKKYEQYYDIEAVALNKLKVLLIKYNEAVAREKLVENQRREAKECLPEIEKPLSLLILDSSEKREGEIPSSKIRVKTHKQGNLKNAKKPYKKALNKLDLKKEEPIPLNRIFYLDKDDFETYSILIGCTSGKLLWEQVIHCLHNLEWRITKAAGIVFKFKFDKNRWILPSLNFEEMRKEAREEVETNLGQVIRSGHEPHAKFKREYLDDGRLSNFKQMLIDAGFTRHNVCLK